MSRRFPEMGNEQQAIIDLLEIIARNTGGLGTPGGAGGDVTIDESVTIEGDVGSGSSRYVSTGARPVLLDSMEFDDIPLGIVGKIVNIRFTDDIVVAFSEEYPESRDQIGLRGAESPFTIGGSVPLNAETVWFKPAETSKYALYQDGELYDEDGEPVEEEPQPPAIQLIAYE